MGVNDITPVGEVTYITQGRTISMKRQPKDGASPNGKPLPHEKTFTPLVGLNRA